MANTDNASTAPLDPIDYLELAKLVHRGIPSGALKKLAVEIGIGVLELSDSLQLARRTVTRRLAQHKLLTQVESERILRVTRLLRKAQVAFEDEGAAQYWFKRRLPELGGKSPLELCASEPGGREVELVLGRFEHGVIA